MYITDRTQELGKLRFEFKRIKNFNIDLGISENTENVEFTIYKGKAKKYLELKWFNVNEVDTQYKQDMIIQKYYKALTQALSNCEMIESLLNNTTLTMFDKWEERLIKWFYDVRGNTHIDDDIERMKNFSILTIMETLNITKYELWADGVVELYNLDYITDRHELNYTYYVKRNKNGKFKVSISI